MSITVTSSIHPTALPLCNRAEHNASQPPYLVLTTDNAMNLARLQEPASKGTVLKSLPSRLAGAFREVWEWIQNLLRRITGRPTHTNGASIPTRIAESSPGSPPPLKSIPPLESLPRAKPVERSPQSDTLTLMASDTVALATVRSIQDLPVQNETRELISAASPLPLIAKVTTHSLIAAQIAPLPRVKAIQDQETVVQTKAQVLLQTPSALVITSPLHNEFVEDSRTASDIALCPLAAPIQQLKTQTATTDLTQEFPDENVSFFDSPPLSPRKPVVSVEGASRSTLTATQTTVQTSNAVSFHQRTIFPRHQSATQSSPPALKLNSEGGYLTKRFSSSPQKPPARTQAELEAAKLALDTKGRNLRESPAKLRLSAEQPVAKAKNSLLKSASNKAPQQIPSVEQPPTLPTTMESPPLPKATMPSIAQNIAAQLPVAAASDGSSIATDALPEVSPITAIPPAPAKPKPRATIVVPGKAKTPVTPRVAPVHAPTQPEPLDRPTGGAPSQGRKLIPAPENLAAMKADTHILGLLADFNNLNSLQWESELGKGTLRPVLDSLKTLYSGKVGDTKLQTKINRLLSQELAKHPFAFWAAINTKTLRTIDNAQLQTFARDFVRWKKQVLSLEKDLSALIDSQVQILQERQEAAIARIATAASKAEEAGPSVS